MNRFITIAAIATTAFFLVIPARAQTVPMITLTNGPPNIPNTSPCTTTSCAWIGAGWPSGTHVSLVYADLVPISSDYSGSFSLSGADAGSFSISTAGVRYTDPFGNTKTRNVGEIKTSGVLGARDYFITVSAGSLSQNVTVHAASGNSVGCGAGIPTSGTNILAPNCTYTIVSSGGTSVPNTAANAVYIGAGNGSTVMDGGGSTCYSFGFYTPPLTVIGIQIQNYNGVCNLNSEGQNGTPALVTLTNGVVRNSRFVNNDGTAINFSNGGAFIANNYVNHQGYGGIRGAATSGGSEPLVTVIGNEIGDTNYAHRETCDDAGASKVLGFAPVAFINNYYHDNASTNIWLDTYNMTATISGNTFVRDGLGMELEQARGGGPIDHNVAIHEADGSAATSLQSGCGGQGRFGIYGPVFAYGSANWNVHDNNFSVFTVFDPILGSNNTGNSFMFDDEIGNGAGFVGNNTVHDNTTNFFTTDSNAKWGWDTSTEDTSGSSSTNNHFHLIGGNKSADAHWYWFNQGNAAQTFANYRSSGQDANSTIDTTDTSTTGCTHVACSGSGIGAGGVPLTGPTALSIQSMALSNSTFPPNVANGAVGTVSVTMSDGSAFSGKLSMTGTNSGGFQLSGNTLEEKASGTPAGTYHDFNIVAAQSTASNSPQQISPTVTGVVETPFGGKARSITNRIQAEDFDVGGYGVAYRATDVCGIGIDTAYGSDRLNVYPTADLDGTSNLKIGCNQAGDWHNYTITAATTGAYTLNVRVANVEAGATYHVAIDGAAVVNGIAVPNTGGYDTFATVTSKQFGLTAGQHVMQVALDTAGPSGFGGEFNWMQGTLVKAGAIGAKNIDITVTH